MVSVLAPCFSLSATGLVGKALLYYDTKYGARIRTPKRTFTPPGATWEVNKVWFDLANTRSKTLNKEQKRAWNIAYPGKCDSWRDIFMGKQIELWNLSPSNNLTWPPVVAQPVGDIIFGGPYLDSEGEHRCWFEEYNYDLVRRWTVGSLWWLILDNPGAPTASSEYTFRTWTSYGFVIQWDHVNYLWGGVRYIDGQFSAHLIDRIDLT